MLVSATVKLALAVFLVTLASPVNADDRKYVAVLEFDGPRAANVRGEVMRLVAAKSWVTSSSKLDGRTIREFALDHDVELVVQGSVAKRGSDYQISVRFIRGTTGKTIVRTTASGRQPALDHASRKRFERDFVRALAAIPTRIGARESP